MGDDLFDAETPGLAGVFKSSASDVAICDVPELQRRELPPQSLPGHAAQTTLETLMRVRIHDVPQVPVGDQDVLPAIEIDVHHHGGPRPAACLNAGSQSRLRERSISAVQEERVTLLLQLGL